MGPALPSTKIASSSKMTILACCAPKDTWFLPKGFVKKSFALLDSILAQGLVLMLVLHVLPSTPSMETASPAFHFITCKTMVLACRDCLLFLVNHTLTMRDVSKAQTVLKDTILTRVLVCRWVLAARDMSMIQASVQVVLMNHTFWCKAVDLVCLPVLTALAIGSTSAKESACKWAIYADNTTS